MSIQRVSFERDGRIFLVAPVAPVQPTDDEVATYAFSKAVRDGAPNPHIAWYRGQYVEADHPNDNGAMWAADDLAIASLTPMLMPVTVMHDPRTAVGLIADTKLLMRDEQASVPRSRIDNVLAIWKHRFPEVAEEAQSNYAAGTLMQSMECRPSHYDCSSCGKSYPKLPGGAEQANWCGHLRGEEGVKAVRILRGVCFTGTGLIFGTRGARGAYSEAHLEPLMDEVAEFHERARHEGSTRPKPNKPKRRNRMEIDDKRYEELIASEAKVKDLESRLQSADESAGKVPDLERKIEQLEIDKKKAEDESAAEKQKREGLEEQARTAALAAERYGKLGDGFKAKLPESVRTRLEEQAKAMTDDDWQSRIDELAEMTGVKSDEGAPAGEGGSSGDTFTREETARAGVGGKNNGGSGGEVTPQRRRSVVAGLVHPPKAKA